MNNSHHAGPQAMACNADMYEEDPMTSGSNESFIEALCLLDHAPRTGGRSPYASRRDREVGCGEGEGEGD